MILSTHLGSNHVRDHKYFHVIYTCTVKIKYEVATSLNIENFDGVKDMNALEFLMNGTSKAFCFCDPQSRVRCLGFIVYAKHHLSFEELLLPLYTVI